MKQHHTRVFRALSIFYLAFPLTYLPATVYLFDIPLERLSAILIEPFFLATAFLAVITGYGLHEMRRWGWYFLQGAQVLVFLYSIRLVLRHGQTHHPILGLLIAGVLLALIHRRISLEVRVPYFMPQISWWESDPKFRTQIAAKVLRSNGKLVDADILDLSMAGAFIKCKPDFLQNEVVEVHCQLFGREWHGGGLVVWKTMGAVIHPRGIGVKFGAMDRHTRRVLKAATLKLKKIYELNHRRRYLMSTEEYRRTLAKLTAPLHRSDDGA